MLTRLRRRGINDCDSPLVVRMIGVGFYESFYRYCRAVCCSQWRRRGDGGHYEYISDLSFCGIRNFGAFLKERLQPTPIISDQEFWSYDVTNHAFTVTAKVANRLPREDTAFVLVAGGERIYVGFFRPTISSFMGSQPTISVSHLRIYSQTNETFEIQKGIVPPGTSSGDVRNHQRILDAVK